MRASVFDQIPEVMRDITNGMKIRVLSNQEQFITWANQHNAAVNAQ